MSWKRTGVLLERTAASFLKPKGNEYDCHYSSSFVFYNTSGYQYLPPGFGFNFSQEDVGELPREINQSGLDISDVYSGGFTLNPSSKEFIPHWKQRHGIFQYHAIRSPNLNPSADEFIPQPHQRHGTVMSHPSLPQNLNPRALEFKPQSNQRRGIFQSHLTSPLNLNPRAEDFIPQSKQRQDIFMSYPMQPHSLNHQAKEFIPQSKQRHDIFMSYSMQPHNLNHRAKEFIPQSKQRHDILMSYSMQPHNLNHRAKEFIPRSMNLNPSADEFIPQSKLKHSVLDLESTPLTSKPRGSFHKLLRNNTKLRPGKPFLARLEEYIRHDKQDEIQSADHFQQESLKGNTQMREGVIDADTTTKQQQYKQSLRLTASHLPTATSQKCDFRRTPRRPNHGCPRRDEDNDHSQKNGPDSPLQNECLWVFGYFPYPKLDEFPHIPNPQLNAQLEYVEQEADGTDLAARLESAEMETERLRFEVSTLSTDHALEETRYQVQVNSLHEQMEADKRELSNMKVLVLDLLKQKTINRVDKKLMQAQLQFKQLCEDMGDNVSTSDMENSYQVLCSYMTECNLLKLQIENEAQTLQEKLENGQQVDMSVIEKHPPSFLELPL